jgi:hypothetical protein
LKSVCDTTSSYFQIEDLNQQAQVAAAEKFKAPEVSPATEAGGSTTVRETCVVVYISHSVIKVEPEVYL